MPETHGTEQVTDQRVSELTADAARRAYARALGIQPGGIGTWQTVDQRDRDTWISVAHAAIEALRGAAPE